MPSKKTTERREFRFALATPNASEGDTSDDVVVLEADRTFRNLANVREAAAAWSGKHRIAIGTVVVLESGLVREVLSEDTLAARRKPHEEQSAKYRKS